MNNNTLAQALEGITADINKTNGAATPVATDEYAPKKPVSIGEDCAQQIRKAAATTADAVVAQADEQLAVAKSLVAQAEALLTKAQNVADGIRIEAERRAQDAMDIDNRMSETSTLLLALQDKFSQTPVA